MKYCGTGNTDLQVTLRVEKQVLGLDVPVRDPLAVEVVDACEDLLEAALDLGRGHAPALDGSIEVAAGTELHHLAPVCIFVLNEVDRLHDVDVM